MEESQASVGEGERNMAGNLTREQFYKTHEWEVIRKVVIDKHTDEEGFVHCAVCGKPILKKYDLVIHHIKELTDANVNDYTVSLNPDNLEPVHFGCHNKIHARAEGHREYRKRRRVYIVYGAPCAGKLEWVKNNASWDDLVVDIDSLWDAVSIDDSIEKPNTIKQIVFGMRDNIYDAIKHRAGSWKNAYVVTTSPLIGDRERLKQRVGADEVIYIETTRQECLDNLVGKDFTTEKALEYVGYINEWWDRYQPDEDTPRPVY